MNTTHELTQSAVNGMASPAESPPHFSVIIPSFSRPVQLARCLNAVAACDYPAMLYEVIVVDDGSPTPLDPRASWPSHAPTLKCLRQQNAGPAAARNHGARAARGQFLAFLDDDCTPDHGWLAGLSAALERHPDALVGGHVTNILHENLFAEASQQLVSYLCGYYNRDPEQARFFTSNNLAVSREAFFAAGAFDDAYCRTAAEDRELCDRWLQQGRRLVAAPAAVVRHAHDLSMTSFVRQHFEYGKGAFQFHSARARRQARPLRTEPLSFYIDLMTYPWRTGHRNAGVIVPLFVVAQAANAIGFFWQAAGTSRVARNPG